MLYPSPNRGNPLVSRGNMASPLEGPAEVRVALRRRPFLRRPLQPVHRLVEPTPEEAPPDGEIDDAVAVPDRIHAEGRVHEGAALRVGELPVNEHAAERAVHVDLPQIIHAIYEEVSLLASDDRMTRHLHELRPLLEPLSLDLEYAWKPLRIAARVADQLPHGRDRRVQQCLLVDLRHQPPISADMLWLGASGPSASSRSGGDAHYRGGPRRGCRARGRWGFEPRREGGVPPRLRAAEEAGQALLPLRGDEGLDDGPDRRARDRRDVARARRRAGAEGGSDDDHLRAAARVVLLLPVRGPAGDQAERARARGDDRRADDRHGPALPPVASAAPHPSSRASG